MRTALRFAAAIVLVAINATSLFAQTRSPWQMHDGLEVTPSNPNGLVAFTCAPPQHGDPCEYDVATIPLDESSWLEPVAGVRRGRIVARVFLYGGFLLAGLPWAFSHVLTRTFRTPVSSRPAKGYEQLQLISDGLKLELGAVRGAEARPRRRPGRSAATSREGPARPPRDPPP